MYVSELTDRKLYNNKLKTVAIDIKSIINLRGVSTKLNKYIVFTMQTYKELIHFLFIGLIQ